MIGDQLPLWTFELLGVLAIFAGGCLAAFSAKMPNRLASWAGAYLVIVVGLFVILMTALLVLVYEADTSWQLVVFYIIILTIAVTMPIGLVLSRRRRVKSEIVI